MPDIMTENELRERVKLIFLHINSVINEFQPEFNTKAQLKNEIQDIILDILEDENLVFEETEE